MQRLSDQYRPSPNDTKLPDPTDGEGKVISKELRGLLRKDVEVVDAVGNGMSGGGDGGGAKDSGEDNDADTATTPASGGRKSTKQSGAGV